MRLVWPAAEYLASYSAALERGWSPDEHRGKARALEELAKINADPVAFVSSLVDREAKGSPVTLPEGSVVPRLPGYVRWLWDGEFCGDIGFRWQPGTADLPPSCRGHIGYGVVPWKQGKGYATQALRLLLREIEESLPYVEITTDQENIASQRVIQANGGVLIERFTKPPQYGPTPCLRFRIHFQ